MAKQIDFPTFFKDHEADFIKAIGEKEWFENKVYFPGEIIDLVEKWQKQNS